MPKRRAEDEPIIGTPNAQEIYLWVGIALSWWEASEDILMSLFRSLIGYRDTAFFETYIAAPRGRRNQILMSVVDSGNGKLLTEVEIQQLRKAMKALDQLATTRNEIAHGHCSSVQEKRDDRVVMEGNFLLPALSEGMRVDRQRHRYYHTAKSLEEFVANVRVHRGTIMDISTAFVARQQNARIAMDSETASLNDFIDQVASGGFPRERVGRVIQRLSHMPPKAQS
jgi:hypothetical protein